MRSEWAEFLQWSWAGRPAIAPACQAHRVCHQLKNSKGARAWPAAVTARPRGRSDWNDGVEGRDGSAGDGGAAMSLADGSSSIGRKWRPPRL